MFEVRERLKIKKIQSQVCVRTASTSLPHTMPCRNEEIMVLLPSFNDSFPSSKTPEEICSVLQAVTSPPKLRLFQPCNEEFIGKVTPSRFRVVSNMSCSNSFLPCIHGSIHPAGNGSEIIIKMRLHPAVAVFCSIWLGFMAFFFLCGLLFAFADGFLQALPLLGPSLGMFTFAQVLIRLGFLIPARKARQRLRELLS